MGTYNDRVHGNVRGADDPTNYAHSQPENLHSKSSLEGAKPHGTCIRTGHGGGTLRPDRPRKLSVQSEYIHR